PGEVIIQTYQPYHPAIMAAKEHDYEGFYKREIAIREQHLYSPFSESVKLIYAHENAKKAADEALKLYGECSDLRKHRGIIVDYSPNYIPKLYGKFTWNILIRGSDPRNLLTQLSLPPGWKIDVDPR
ncbi:MAG: primosomal protein N', partial [Candidatus Gracilibacteria bacterium]|nr:primosomal protein N' [Candidatus Gracilibacteria bacterium]